MISDWERLKKRILRRIERNLIELERMKREIGKEDKEEGFKKSGWVRKKIEMKLWEFWNVMRSIGKWKVRVKEKSEGGREGRIKKKGVEKLVGIKINKIGGESIRIEKEELKIGVEKIKKVLGKVKRGKVGKMKKKMRSIEEGGGKKIGKKFEFDIVNKERRKDWR